MREGSGSREAARRAGVPPRVSPRGGRIANASGRLGLGRRRRGAGVALGVGAGSGTRLPESSARSILAAPCSEAMRSLCAFWATKRAAWSLSSSNGGKVRMRRSSTLMMCQPNWLFTGSEIWPGCSLNAASANSGTMRSLVNQPRSPPSPAGSLDSSVATLAKSSPFLTRSSAAFASSSVGSRMWRAWTSSDRRIGLGGVVVGLVLGLVGLPPPCRSG